MIKMANVYESDSYNIEKVITSPTGQNYLVEIQRLPTNTYPEKTQVPIPFSEFSFNIDLSAEGTTDADRATNRTNASSLSKSDFLAVATTYIVNELANFDAEFDGTPATLQDLTTDPSLY